MPAPETLQVQTPGQPITQPTTEQKSEPEYTAKHNGGGRWRIYSTSLDDWFSDFVATGEGAKEAAQAEADRLNAGGTPVTKPADPAPAAAAPASPTQPTTEQAPAQRAVPILTPEGWLVPELPANARKE